MGRPRISTEVLKARGSFDKHPERLKARRGEPKPLAGDIGPPPACFLNEYSPTAKLHLEMWHELLSNYPEGALTRRHRVALEQAARCLATIRRGSTKSADQNALALWLAKLDRWEGPVVTQVHEHENDPFAEFADEGRARPN